MYNNIIVERDVSTRIKNTDLYLRATGQRDFKLKDVDFGYRELEGNKEVIRFLYQSIKYKKNKNIFENNINSAQVDMKQINAIANKLKTLNPIVYKNIVEFKAQKLGPGEVLIYLIHDKVHLAGGTEDGDVRINDNKWEVKGAKLHRPGELGNTHSSNIATNFTFGSKIEEQTNRIVEKIVKLKNREDVKAGIDKQSFRKTASKSNIGTNELNYMRTNFASDFIPLEREYAKTAANALKAKNQKLILINNNLNSSRYGQIVDIKAPLKPSDILSIREHTTVQGTSPRIKIGANI